MIFAFHFLIHVVHLKVLNVNQTCTFTPYATKSLTLHAMGTGYSGPTSLSTCSVLIPAGCNLLLTSWIEVVPLSNVVKFLLQNLVCHFCLPHIIISDDWINFASKEVAIFCSKYKVTHQFSTPYYPQGNGQAEISNHTNINNLCKSLDKAKGKWVENLSWVLWS